MTELTRIDGTINHIGETLEVGQKGFKKRELWLSIDPDAERPQFVCLEATFEMIDVLDGFSVGEEVVAHYVLGGRIWKAGHSSSIARPAEPRCFNSLTLKKIQTLADRDAYAAAAETTDEEDIGF